MEICLISGGASALLSLPAPGISLDDERAVTKVLLHSGALIGVMNEVCKSLSAIKAGRLAAATAPERFVTYVISDVPGDDPASIISGPAIPARSNLAEVFSLLKRYRIKLPPHLASAIERNVVPVLADGDVRTIAPPKLSLDAATEAARRFGLAPLVLGGH